MTQNPPISIAETPFALAYKGSFRSMLRWHHLDALWGVLRSLNRGQWCIYAVGETPPSSPASAEEMERFLAEIDALLRSEHDEDYCGIVYADDADAPTFVKIYDPNNLGSVCGPGSGPPPAPGWILSLLPPVDLNIAFAPPQNRRRWWQRLFHAE